MTSPLDGEATLHEAQLYDAFIDIGRGVAVGSFSGFVAGLAAGGVGSRVAMRIVALTAGAGQQGAITDAEATVGKITLEGTLFLLFAGAMIGVAGGVIYGGTRSWLKWAGPWRGTLFGAALLALFGATIVRGDNPDFARFGYAWLNIGLFSAIIVIFGVMVAPLYEWVGARMRPSLSLTGLIATAFLAAGMVVSVGGVAALLAFVIGERRRGSRTGVVRARIACGPDRHGAFRGPDTRRGASRPTAGDAPPWGPRCWPGWRSIRLR